MKIAKSVFRQRLWFVSLLFSFFLIFSPSSLQHRHISPVEAEIALKTTETSTRRISFKAASRLWAVSQNKPYEPLHFNVKVVLRTFETSIKVQTELARGRLARFTQPFRFFFTFPISLSSEYLPVLNGDFLLE